MDNHTPTRSAVHPFLRVTREGNSWVATGLLRDGSQYLAVASNREQLDDRIRESARVEGWTAWAILYTPIEMVVTL